MQQYYNSNIVQEAYGIQYSFPQTAKINSYSSRLVHSACTIFRTTSQRNRLTLYKNERKVI